jgi:hypothetical protein
LYWATFSHCRPIPGNQCFFSSGWSSRWTSYSSLLTVEGISIFEEVHHIYRRIRESV